MHKVIERPGSSAVLQSGDMGNETTAALRLIAEKCPELAEAAVEAMGLRGRALQTAYNGLAARAASKLSAKDRAAVLALAEPAQGEAFDAMLRCRMTQEQLSALLPARARAAGYSDVSKFVRHRLFEESAPAAPAAPSQAELDAARRKGFEEGVAAAVRAVEALEGRPRLSAVLEAVRAAKGAC